MMMMTEINPMKGTNEQTNDRTTQKFELIVDRAIRRPCLT
jgi:hypothetical protein